MKAPQALVISTFPPMRCGIGAYAAQQVFALRRQGTVAHTAALSAEAMGTYRLLLSSPRNIARFMLDTLFVQFDRIEFHYVDSFIPINRNQIDNLLISALQMALFVYLRLKSRRSFTIIVHEFVATHLRGRMFDLLRRTILGLATRCEFHTKIERDAAFGHLGFSNKRASVVDHARYFERRFDGDKAQARETLGLLKNRTIFLCIGFLQAHKAFERAVQAFSIAGREDADLYIVGSQRIRHPTVRRYRKWLANLVDATPRVHLIERFVDDEEFDAWICATDMVVVPYREIWTSGVMARAGLYHRPIAMHAHRTLIEQAQGRGIASFEDEAELAEIMGHAGPSADPGAAISRLPVNRRAKILMIAPLYGAKITGGAEMVIARYASLLADRYDVEVWSTRSSRLEPRDNAQSDSDASDPRITLRRFDTNVNAERAFHFLHRRVSQGSRNLLWQNLWKHFCLNGKGLARALEAEQWRFDAIILPHYFYGTTHLCATIAPAKTIVHPFVHDEPALRTKVIARLFGAPALCTHNSEAELIAARRALLVPVFDGRVVGNVVTQPTAEEQRNAFDLAAIETKIGGCRYLLYIGRITADKNVDDLVRWFQHARRTMDPSLKLVLIGEGPLALSSDDAEGVLRYDRVSSATKWALLSRCLALTQLSVLESFSLVVMEAWLSRRPVIVHERCDATSLHVRLAQAGFAVGHAPAFAAAAALLLEDADIGARMGTNGEAYVHQNYSEEAVSKRLFGAVDRVIGFASSANATSNASVERRESQLATAVVSSPAA